MAVLPSSAPMTAMYASPSSVADSAWYPDSGATNHLTSSANHLGNRSVYSGGEQIFLANGKSMPICNIGNASVQQFSFTKPLLLNHLLHVPTVSKNLLSVSKFAHDNHVYFEFHPHSCYVKCQVTKKVLLRGILKDGLYYFPNLKLLSNSTPPQALLSTRSTTCSSDSYVLWHCRLGHASLPVVNNVLSICNLPLFNKNSHSVCSSCCLGKHHRLPFPHSTTYSHPLELIHTDVWGPAPIESANGFRYFVHFIDAYSKFTWIYRIKKKSDVFTVFQQFKSMVELQHNTKIKMLQYDNGGEFRALTNFLNTCGIIHRFSCPHTPLQNGTAERKNRHIVELGLSMLAHASMPLSYWDEAFLSAVHIINRLPPPTLSSHSPYELLFHHIPS